jgi:hypothetical protein
MAMGQYTNSVDGRRSWKADSSLAGQEILRLLWNPKVRYQVHNSPRLDHILNQLNPVQTPPHFFKTIPVLSSYLRLSFPNGLIRFVFRQIIVLWAWKLQTFVTNHVYGLIFGTSCILRRVKNAGLSARTLIWSAWTSSTQSHVVESLCKCHALQSMRGKLWQNALHENTRERARSYQSFP